MGRKLAALAVTAGLITAAGCGAPSTVEPAPPQAKTRASAPSRNAPRPPPPESVAANELGVVPVLMYHRITPEPTSVYDRTPEQFRAELQRLAEENYVPITTAEYATGRIDIPAGTHPVVLTFDDASPSQFALDASGKPARATAVRILLEVAEEHPQFRPVASFYVTTPPFGNDNASRSLTWLHEHGFEIGNHTLTHVNLGQASDQQVRHQIAAMHRRITDAVPGATVSTMALPLGVYPDDKQLAMSGSSDGVTYDYDAVLLVGANPASSPYSAEFDPLGVPRIRSQGLSGKGAEFGSTTWLNKLAENPQRRYTSDGDPDMISFPSGTGEQISKRYAERAQPY